MTGHSLSMPAAHLSEVFAIMVCVRPISMRRVLLVPFVVLLETCCIRQSCARAPTSRLYSWRARMFCTQLTRSLAHRRDRGNRQTISAGVNGGIIRSRTCLKWQWQCRRWQQPILLRFSWDLLRIQDFTPGASAVILGHGRGTPGDGHRYASAYSIC
jgi:hypothetical protein